MLKQRAREVAALMAIIDAVLLSCGFVVALIIRVTILPYWSARLGPIDAANYSLVPLLVVPTTLFFLWHEGLYESLRARHYSVIVLRLARCFGLQALAGGTLIFVMQIKGASRALYFLYLTISFFVLLADRFAVRWVARSARSKGFNTRNIIVAGQGGRLEQVIQVLTAHPELGFRLLGAVSVHPAQVPADLNYLGRPQDLPVIAQSHVVDAVLFAMAPHELEDLTDVILGLEEMGIRIHLRVDFLPTLLSRTILETLGNLPMLSLTTTPHDLLALGLKRGLDIAVATVGLIVLSPLLALCATAIKLDSRGHALFRQVRVGLNGRTFVLYKFRSMFEGERRVLTEVLVRNEARGPVFKMRDDPRITRVGRCLRKLSLDELPQLWNVLRGNMSLVGPRPPLPSEVSGYQRWQRRRLSVRPGLTCIWQVSGRSEVDFERWMQMDMYYIDHWSLGLDLKLLVQTVPAVLRGRGAQ